MKEQTETFTLPFYMKRGSWNMNCCWNRSWSSWNALPLTGCRIMCNRLRKDLPPLTQVCSCRIFSCFSFQRWMRNNRRSLRPDIKFCNWNNLTYKVGSNLEPLSREVAPIINFASKIHEQ